MIPDPFYPIVESTAWLRRLLPLGVRFVQLRVKDREGDALRTEIAAARVLCRRRSAGPACASASARTTMPSSTARWPSRRTMSRSAPSGRRC